MGSTGRVKGKAGNGGAETGLFALKLWDELTYEEWGAGVSPKVMNSRML